MGSSDPIPTFAPPSGMHPHHASTIQNIIARLFPIPSVLALILSGSIAHGFATAESDVDVLVVLTEEAYAERQQTGEINFVDAEVATYPGGFVDGKYLSLGFLREVAARGSEPARFALEGAVVLFDRIGGGALEDVLRRAVRYPVEDKRERVVRFRAQLDAWRCFCGEARQKGNAYWLGLAATKLVLFGGRLILAENEVLYPYHKWFLRVLEGVKEKPEGLMEAIKRLVEDPSEENVEAFYELVKGFRDWPQTPNRWGAQFMRDTELTWMSGHAPVDDL
ncbi:hypothetical protein MYCTH_2297195 [Thermothelomyces thermophilus ATCC 42464]|uniref:Polymerase nucleotidyl transferase domain-containing protein n=1 Tax=Thermothelomyces thermophilus (strain ATCC 42464 / BCRC 31852 / DSM 1799) TaxID=573729 RepID=G2Q4P4_THET4|nr:uncharacterized protein MYCTH_2297195 [Thermothelomyces thermophilus ATCC 42464]AEO54533.1 hypothetical protein MYCTH_2297195 [Thermothelomyces thermophilus ATCC 42464]